MANEIERKFLIINDLWRKSAGHSVFYRQGYLSGAKNCSIRVRVGGEKAYLNIKSVTLGITRKEYEYAIPIVDANEMLDQFCEGSIIEKRRYLVEHADHTWEIDVFEGDNTGLIVAELELDSEDEAFELPNWAGAEVSHDARYYNVSLVKHPFKDWKI